MFSLKPAIDASQTVLAYLTVSTNSIYYILAKAMLLQLHTTHKLIKSLFALCWNDILVALLVALFVLLVAVLVDLLVAMVVLLVALVTLLVPLLVALVALVVPLVELVVLLVELVALLVVLVTLFSFFLHRLGCLCWSCP